MNTIISVPQTKLKQAQQFAKHIDPKTAIVLNCCHVVFRPGAIEIYPKNRFVLGVIHRNESIQNTLVFASEALNCRCIITLKGAGTWVLSSSD